MARRELFALIFAAAACDGFSEADTPPGTDRDASIDAPSGDPDGASDAGDAAVAKRCDPRAKFGERVALATINTPDIEATARLTPDELSIYFERYVTTVPDIFMATRPTRTAAFGEAVPVAAISSPAFEVHPFPTVDGKSLYFARSEAGAPLDIWVSRRASLGAELGPPTVVIASDASDTFPFVESDVLWFARNVDATRFGIFATSPDGKATPVQASELSTLESSDYGPVLSSDGLTMYFSSKRDGGPTPESNQPPEDIYVAHRDGRADPFTAPVLVTELSTGYRELVGWLSPDDCRIYFSSNRLGSLDVYVAERDP